MVLLERVSELDYCYFNTDVKKNIDKLLRKEDYLLTDFMTKPLTLEKKNKHADQLGHEISR
jgi:hypothetical protein